MANFRSAIRGRTMFHNVGSIDFTFDTKNMVFDRNLLHKNNGKLWRRINESPLKKIGLQIRRRAISSIPKAERAKKYATRQKPSRPGRPPKSRDRVTLGGHPLRRIYSVPIMADTAVIVGSIGLFSKKHPVPGIHEHGRTVSVRVPVRKRGKARSKKQREAAARLFKQGRIKRKPIKLQSKRVSYPPRPFMKPAMRKQLNKLPAYYRNTLITG